MNDDTNLKMEPPNIVTHYKNRDTIPASGNARIAHRVRVQEKVR